MLLSKYIQKIQEQVLNVFGNTNLECTDLVYDSRKATEKSLFICIIGTKFNSHDSIDELYSKNIRAFIVEDAENYDFFCKKYVRASFILVKNTRRALAQCADLFFQEPQKSLKIIALTGTKGKTSTSFMISQILKECGLSVGVIGTNGVYFNDFHEELSNSTPESYELHRYFAMMKAANVEYIIMEASSQAAKMDRIYGIDFDIAVFTNISPDHIGPNEHESFDEYINCKGTIFKQCKIGIVNNDDEYSDFIKNILNEQNAKIVTYSLLDKKSNYRADNVKYRIDNGLKTSFVLNESEEINVSVPGKFSVFNSLCAISVCETLGQSIDKIKSALLKVHIIGRVEPVKHEKCATSVLIDYAHNALSMQSLFEAIAEYHPKRIICVFGCGGNRSKLRRYDMGEISGNNATISVVTSDNPRFEEPLDIIDDILIGMKKTSGKYVVIPDRREAIAYALTIAKHDDIVILAGKGQEDYQEIKGVKYHLDEREVVKEYYNKL